MATRREVMDVIMEEVQTRNLTSLDIQALGYARNTVQAAFSQLTNEGKLQRHMKDYRTAVWALPGKKIRLTPIDLSDLPKDLLLMMGYTNIEPTGGYVVMGDLG
jgi:hypothetical protein